jgi:methylenetetrahydrofolate reductase (NADPH)
MKINELYSKAKSPVFSFEFFPPKTPEGEVKLKATIGELKKLNPGFVSVTYGAGGSTRDKTIEICAEIQTVYSIPSMCHFTCVGASKEEIKSILKNVESRGIKNIIALRGDPPKGEGKFTPPPGGFSNATELVEFVRHENFSFCVAGGCYPEKHPESPTLESDIHYLKQKVSAGVDFLVTQLFFSNRVFVDFLKRARTAGITSPILPGIMPITSYSQIQRFKEMADCEIPDDFVSDLEKVKDNPSEFMRVSISYTIAQCRELLSMGISPGIHFYTLNQSTATMEIMKALQK